MHTKPRKSPDLGLNDPLRRYRIAFINALSNIVTSHALTITSQKGKNKLRSCKKCSLYENEIKILSTTLATD